MLPPALLRDATFHHLPATSPPWHDTGLDLETGSVVTWFVRGRVYLSRLLDVWAPASFQLWARVGPEGPIFRGTRVTHTFDATRPGRLWLASYFPGEWADSTGRLATDPAQYADASGGLEVGVLRWNGTLDTVHRYLAAAVASDVPQAVRREAARINTVVPPPEGWNYLWYLGPGEIFHDAEGPHGERAIACHTHGDVGILRRDARIALQPGTTVSWSWKVDELPVDLAEDTLPTHDYVSFAVEFDDGQDLTYYWSSCLPAGTVYRCPLPTWRDKETHVVVRTGTARLGEWLHESRDLHADYVRMIGGPAREVVRVWLIANSLLQRGHGRCVYAGIELRAGAATIPVL